MQLPEGQIVYGLAPEDAEQLRAKQVKREAAVLEAARERSSEVGLRQFAKEARVDPRHLSRVLAGKRELTPEVLMRIEETLER